MNEAYDVRGETSEYDSREKHRPLLDLEFKKALGRRILHTIIFGAVVVWGLTSAGHGWWAAAAVVVAIVSLIYPIMDFTYDRVRIFKDGILTSYLHFPWNGKPSWNQFPWDAILHLDLSDGYFRIATTSESSSHGHVFCYMGKIDRKEKGKLINELKSLQQRGDIPSTLRIVE